MLIFEILRVALDAILANKMRSLLTTLGVVIGIAAVITMVALGEGAQRSVESRLAGLGVNLLTVRPGQSFFGGIGRGQAKLTVDDAEALLRSSEHIRAVAPELESRFQVEHGSDNANLSIMGTWPSYFQVNNFELAGGRLFSEAEDRGRRREHRIAPGGDADFNVRDQATLLSTMQETTQTFSFLLAGIAAISLVVGGIMNIMLVSVTERTREIGLRKAVGARKRDILLQFLIEALVLCFAGGALGLLAGAGGSLLLQHMAGWNVAMAPKAVFLAFGFSAAVGIFFGLWPARRAAALAPIEALRYE